MTGLGRRPEADTLAAILGALGPIEGRHVLDVGCGHGRFAAALSSRGAKVAAVDPDEISVAAARRAAPAARIERAGAEALPFLDAVFDGVVMLNSLHHVPAADQRPALRGLARVAKPGAPVVIVEPLAEGSFFDAMRPVEDETAIRAEAQTAIAEACGADGPLELIEVIEYERVDVFPDVDSFLARLCAVDPARETALAAARPEVERLVAACGEPIPSGFALRQPHRLHRLTKRA